MMKRSLLILFAMYVTALMACDTGCTVIKSRAVLKDGSSFTAYFRFSSLNDVDWKLCPFTDEEGLMVKNGRNYLPEVIHETEGYNKGDYSLVFEGETPNTLFYTTEVYKYPWGYYQNIDEQKRVESTELDSLIYMSEFLPHEFRLVSGWHFLNSKQLAILNKGICSFDYASEPMNESIYISTRDTISEAELELYTLHDNFLGSREKAVNRVSYFFNTTGNRQWLETAKEPYNKWHGKYLVMQDHLNISKIELNELLPLINRNILMDDDFKQTLRDSIRVATANINLLCSYLNAPNLNSEDAQEMLSGLRWIVRDDKRDINPDGDELWDIFARVLIPALPNYFETDPEVTGGWEAEYDSLADIGIVVLEGWYP